MSKSNRESLPHQGFHVTTPAQDRLCGEAKCAAYDVCKTRFGSQECQGHRATLSALSTTTPDQK